MKNRIANIGVGTLACGVFGCAHLGEVEESRLGLQDKRQKPNIVLIMADDLGLGLLSHAGQKIIKTPNIDKIANEGVRFTNAYSCMLCAPARASLITGRHDCHADGFDITSAGIYKNISTGKYTHEQIEDAINKSLPPVPEERVFLGELAKRAGYETAQFGKLEWGFAASHRQMQRHGWDYYLGYLDHIRAHGFYPPFLFKNGEIMEIAGNTHADCAKHGEWDDEKSNARRWDMTGKEVYSQNIFMDGIMEFISDNRENPFLLYFPTQLPHGPVSIPKVHPDFVDDPRLSQIEKEYASMVKMLDDNVGQILDKLKELNIDDNTIVIFTSDNGHEIYYSKRGRIHKPYTNMKTGERFNDVERKYYSDLAGDVFDGNAGRAGLKRSNLQGGVEVPLVMRWPEVIKPGRTSEQLVANYDIVATVAEIVGQPTPPMTDGISFAALLRDEEPKDEHEFVVFSSFTGPTLITKDGWKIRTHLGRNIFELYYLPDDYKEEHNLADKYPEKLELLKSQLIEVCDGNLKNGHYGGYINVEKAIEGKKK